MPVQSQKNGGTSRHPRFHYPNSLAAVSAMRLP